MNSHALQFRPGGMITALVTPFSHGEIHRGAFFDLIETQITKGVGGLCPATILGESPALNAGEKITLIKRCVETAAKRVPVIAATGTSDTLSTIALSEAAAAVGADAVLIAAPTCGQPTQEGLFRHYEAIAKQVQVPIMVQNMPTPLGMALALPTIERLAEISSIIAIVDACQDRVASVRMIRRMAGRLLQFSSDDQSAVDFVLAGGDGLFSGCANICPQEMASLYGACHQKDAIALCALLLRLEPILEVLRQDPGPAALKYALHYLHGFPGELRLPLVEVNARSAWEMRCAMAALRDHLTAGQSGQHPRLSA